MNDGMLEASIHALWVKKRKSKQVKHFSDN